MIRIKQRNWESKETINLVTGREGWTRTDWKGEEKGEGESARNGNKG